MATPTKSGLAKSCKVVNRKYAFGDPTVPREETQYLKVVYDGKYPTPPHDVCREGGKSFAKILGAGASNLENFILKRRLLGPCWISIRQPVANTGAPLSWCKLEVQIDSPKQIGRLDLLEPGKNRPAPPVVTVSVKMKTVVNPKTHKSEVVSVSAICHKHVLLDKSSDGSTSHMTQLSLIRPLAQPGTHGVPKFPRDMDEHAKTMMPQLQRMPNERALLSRLMAQIGSWDPDVLVGHNAWGWDWQVILTRCVELKVSMWSKVGRRRQMTSYSKQNFSNDWAIANAIQGRVLVRHVSQCEGLVARDDVLVDELGRVPIAHAPGGCRTGRHSTVVLEQQDSCAVGAAHSPRRTAGAETDVQATDLAAYQTIDVRSRQFMVPHHEGKSC